MYELKSRPVRVRIAAPIRTIDMDLEDQKDQVLGMSAENFSGSCVQILGLVSRSDLNGSYGRIENYNAAKQRFAVHVPVDDCSMLLKASSLRWIPDPMRQVCPCCHIGDAKSIRILLVL